MVLLKYINGEPTPETKHHKFMVEGLRKLEVEYNLAEYGIYACKWEEIQAFYKIGKLNDTQVKHIYNRKRLYDPSLLNTELVDGEIVEREEDPRRKIARELRKML